jgi:hypothetical protein
MFYGTRDCENMSTVANRKCLNNAELLCEEADAIFTVCIRKKELKIKTRV